MTSDRQETEQESDEIDAAAQVGIEALIQVGTIVVVRPEEKM